MSCIPYDDTWFVNLNRLWKKDDLIYMFSWTRATAKWMDNDDTYTALRCAHVCGGTDEWPAQWQQLTWDKPWLEGTKTLRAVSCSVRPLVLFFPHHVLVALTNARLRGVALPERSACLCTIWGMAAVFHSSVSLCGNSRGLCCLPSD